MSLFLKRIGFILLVFTGVSLLVSFASLWALRQGSFYKPSFLENQVAESSFDYIVLGSSTGLTTLNTQVIDSVLGTRGLNLSMDDTALSSHYLMLQHFVNSDKKTKTCILAASVSSYDGPSKVINGNDYRFLPYGSRDYVQDYYDSFSGSPARVLSYSKWFPIIGVGYYNVELFYPSLISLLEPQKRNRFDAFGNYSYPESLRSSESIKERRKLDIEFRNPYIKRIHNLCIKHNIQLIVYLPPHEQIAAHPVETAFQVINHSAILQDTRYFYDVLHVNALGRQQVSLRFAQEVGGLIGF